MTVWPRHIVAIDAQDEPLVEQAVERAGLLRIHYVPAPAPYVNLWFVNSGDAAIFKLAHPTTTLNANNTAVLDDVASLASISHTLGTLSPKTHVEHVIEAALWYRDDAAKNAYNAAIASLSTRFVGSLPTI